MSHSLTVPPKSQPPASSESFGVHPAASIFPIMSADDFATLKADIQKPASRTTSTFSRDRFSMVEIATVLARNWESMSSIARSNNATIRLRTSFPRISIVGTSRNLSVPSVRQRSQSYASGKSAMDAK